MPEQTQAVYFRLKTKTIASLKKIAAEDERSAAKMADILLNLGIDAWRARQKKERESGLSS